MNLFDYVKLRKNSNVIWDHIAAEINNSDPEDFTDHRTFVNGEVLRSWYKRKKKHEVPVEVTSIANMPISIPMPFEPVLELPNKATLVLADLHCPYHDEEFIKEAVANATDQFYTIDQIVVAGDLLDLDGLSKYSKSHNIARLETELEIVGQMLLYLGEYAPVYITQGNHDARFFDRLDAPMSFQRLISAALNGRSTKHTIKTTDRDYLFIGEHFIVGHLDRASSIPGKLAQGIANKYQRHALAGHEHSVGVFTGDPNALYLGASIGCCADSSKFWYSERRMNAFPFMKKGYAMIDGCEDYFSLFNEKHTQYFSRVMFANNVYNCFMAK